MLFRTHIVIALFVSLFFLSHVTHSISFIPLVIAATILPDIDSAFSKIGKGRLGRLVQLFTKHRGLLHSFTFCLIVTLFFAFYLPVLALPFFLGYALHLLLDSVTTEGIRPFWPFKKGTHGKIPVGGAVEEALCMTFIVIDLVFIISFFF